MLHYPRVRRSDVLNFGNRNRFHDLPPETDVDLYAVRDVDPDALLDFDYEGAAQQEWFVFESVEKFVLRENNVPKSLNPEVRKLSWFPDESRHRNPNIKMISWNTIFPKCTTVSRRKNCISRARLGVWVSMLWLFRKRVRSTFSKFQYIFLPGHAYPLVFFFLFVFLVEFDLIAFNGKKKNCSRTNCCPWSFANIQAALVYLFRVRRSVRCRGKRKIGPIVFICPILTNTRHLEPRADIFASATEQRKNRGEFGRRTDDANSRRNARGKLRRARTVRKRRESSRVVIDAPLCVTRQTRVY